MKVHYLVAAALCCVAPSAWAACSAAPAPDADGAIRFGGSLHTWTTVANLGTPQAGDLVYDTTNNAVSVCNGTAWQTLTAGGGGSPGGSDTQIQYNGSGSFAGNAGLTYSATSKAMTVGGATVTTSNPVLNLSQTWNAGAVTFTGVVSNITDTSSASASKLLDLQVGGSSKFSVNKSGYINIGGQEALKVDPSLRNFGSGTSTLSAITTGAHSIAIGNQALMSTTSGTNNIALGYEALKTNTTGSYNIAIGDDALAQPWGLHDVPTYNIAIGRYAMINGGGSSNIGMGYYSLGAVTTGSSNVGIAGSGALAGVTTGSYNVGIGGNAGYDVTTGNYNIILGHYATTAVGITTGSNNVLIGQDVRPPSRTASNQLNIGNLIYATGLASGTTASTGNVGIGTTSPSGTLDVNGNLYVRNLGNGAGTYPACYDTSTKQVLYNGTCNSSDSRLKENVHTLPGELSNLVLLRPVRFMWKDTVARDHRVHLGLIAQEVEKIYPEVVDTDPKGFKSLQYEKLVAPLIRSVQELKVANDNQVEEIKLLKARLDTLEARR